MAFQIFANNGEIIDITGLYAIPRANLPDANNYDAYGIAAGCAPVTWINGHDFISDTWEAHESGDHPYGWIYYLKGRDTKTNHQYYVDKILANGAFIWGDVYNGGLYIYKLRNDPIYALALFCGYSVDNNETEYDMWTIADYPTAAGTYESMRAITIVEIWALNYNTGWAPNGLYTIMFGGNVYNGDGDCITYPGNAVQIYPTSLDYTISVSQVLVEDSLQNFPTYLTVDPIVPGYVSYQMPDEIFYHFTGGNDYPIHISQGFGAPATPEIAGYDSMGDWAGGSGNLVGNDPNGGGINTTGGGYGDPSKQSDRSGDTGEHQFDDDGTDVGCFTIFNPTKAQLTAFNRWLFQSMFDAGFDSMWNNLKKMYADPSEYIIGMGVIKYVPDKEASQSTEIKFGNVGTGVFARTVKQWSELDCGSIIVKEQYKSFLDYQGFSTVKIFLPFCGTYDLDQNDVMGSKISLKYNIDNLTGACVAVLDIERADRGKWDDSSIHSKIYRFNGNCMQQLPISEKNYSNSLAAVAGLCSSVVSGAASAATGNAIGVIGGVAGAVSSATNLAPDIIQSGKISDAYGMLDCLKPFIILHRPIRSIPAEYGKHAGYPAMLFKQIGTCKGFTKVRAGGSWTNTFPCTDDEKLEIQKYLENGIMLPE